MGCQDNAGCLWRSWLAALLPPCECWKKDGRKAPRLQSWSCASHPTPAAAHQPQEAPHIMISSSQAKNQLLAGFRKRWENKSILGVFLTQSPESKESPNKKYTLKDLKSMSTPPQRDRLPEFSSSFAFSRTKLQFAPLTQPLPKAFHLRLSSFQQPQGELTPPEPLLIESNGNRS